MPPASCQAAAARAREHTAQKQTLGVVQGRGRGHAALERHGDLGENTWLTGTRTFLWLVPLLVCKRAAHQSWKIGRAAINYLRRTDQRPNFTKKECRPYD
jgi:hypothetical protein